MVDADALVLILRQGICNYHDDSDRSMYINGVPT